MGSQTKLMVAVAGVMLGISGAARAAWIQTASGTYDYLDTANWASGVIDDNFPSTLTLAGAQTLTFGDNRLTPGAMSFNYAGNYGLTLQATGGDRTLTLGGDVSLGTTGGTTANVTIGNTNAGQRINVDLGGVERTFTIAASRTLTLQNTLSNGALAKAGAGTLWSAGNLTYTGSTTVSAGTLVLRGQTSTFTGNISVSGASSTLVIGEQNAISDGCLGNVTNDLSLSNGATLKFGSNNDKAHVILSPYRDFTISGGAKFSTPYGSANVNISGNIVGSGGLDVGATAAQLSGNNTFTGGVSYNSSLRFSSDANIGGSTSTLTRGTNAGTVGLSILGASLTNLSGHTLTFGNGDGFSIDIQDPANEFTWDKSNNRQMNSGGNPTFVKYGLGTLLVTAAQTYSNATGLATVLNGGVFKVDYTAGGSLANGAGNERLAFGGGTLYLLGKTDAAVTQTLSDVRLDAGGGSIVVDNHTGSSTTTLNLGNFTAFVPAAGSSFNIRAINAGTGAAVVTSTQANDATGIIGAGRVVYNGTNWASIVSGTTVGSYTGYATVAAGATPSGTDTSNSELATTSGTSGAVALGGNWTTNTLKIAGGSSLDAGGSTLTLTAGGLLFAGASDYAITNGTLKSANNATTSDLIISNYGGGKLTVGAAIANGGSGASTLTLAGTGTVVLTTANSYTGQTYVDGATLSISSNNQLNNGANTQLNLYSGTLQATDTISTARAVVLGGGGGTFDVANGKTLTLSGAVSGGRLTLANSDGGNGTLVLSGNNGIGSGVAINGGILRLGSNSAIHAQGFSTLSFGSATTATLQINGARTITVAGLTSASSSAVIENGATGAAVLNVYNGADNAFAGTLRDGAAGTLALTKGGGAKLSLAGTNTYTGPTTVIGGTLAVNGSLTGTVSVNGGKLGGTGTVGPVTIASGGTLAAGNSVGTLNTSALTMSAGSILEAEFNATSNDLANVTGNNGLTLNGGSVYLYAENTTDLPALAGGNYHLFAYTGTLGGSIGNLTVANDNPSDDATYAFATSTVGAQNYVDLVVTVPEPAGLAIAAAASTLLLARRRGRRMA